jgi:hypothetical protein
VSPGVSAAGQLIVPLGTGGAINLYNGRGTLPMTGNVVGYYV